MAKLSVDLAVVPGGPPELNVDTLRYKECDMMESTDLQKQVGQVRSRKSNG